MERPIIKIPATRGDTFGYPLPISNDVTSTIRIHLRKTPDAVNYFILSYIDGSVVIPDTITSQLSGAWFFDVEITSEGGIVRTLPNLYEIDFSLDVTRVYGNEAPDGTSDFERNLIIAKEYQVRLPNGEVSTVLTSDDLVAMEALVDQSAASADAALVSEQHAKISEDNSKTEADISTAQAVISAAKADIATAQANIAIAQATISTNQAVISTAKADIATAKAQLASDKADVATAQAVIATAQADIATAQANIAIAQATISTNQAVISTAQAVISTNQASSALDSKNAAGVSETNSANSATASQNSYLAVLALLTAGSNRGLWDANANNPTLANGTGTLGYYFIVNNPGTSLSQTFAVQDLVVYNQSNQWIKVPKSLVIYLNDQWQTATDFVGGIANLFKLTKDNTLLFGVPVELNSLFHVLNAGLNNIVDIPVNALSSAGTEHGVKIVVGGVEIGRYSALSDGSGGVYAALATIQNLLEGYQTTATAGGTTTLTGLSAYNQYFTGSANQTVLLPVVTTLKNGLSYWFTNSSTGTITVQSSGGNTIVMMAAGTTATFSCINIAGGTGTASWSYWYEGVTVASGKKLGVSNSLTLAGTDGTTQTFQASDTIVGRGTTDTLTNKRITARTPAVTQAAAPVINTDNTDQVHIIGLAQAITSMTTNLTGTPSAGDHIWFDITDNGTGRAIAWGAKFEASGTITLPATTVAGVRLDVGFAWNPVTSAWRIISKS